MLSFKQYTLHEDVEAKWVTSVMDNILSGGGAGSALMPLTTGMIKSAFGRVRRITAWHSTSPNLLGKTLSLAGKKKSISTSNAFGPSFVSHGVWEGGIILKVKGDMLAGGVGDIMSMPDVGGRRWVSLEYMGEKYSKNTLSSACTAHADKWTEKSYDYIVEFGREYARKIFNPATFGPMQKEYDPDTMKLATIQSLLKTSNKDTMKRFSGLMSDDIKDIKDVGRAKAKFIKGYMQLADKWFKGIAPKLEKCIIQKDVLKPGTSKRQGSWTEIVINNFEVKDVFFGSKETVNIFDVWKAVKEKKMPPDRLEEYYPRIAIDAVKLLEKKKIKWFSLGVIHGSSVNSPKSQRLKTFIARPLEKLK